MSDTKTINIEFTRELGGNISVPSKILQETALGYFLEFIHPISNIKMRHIFPINHPSLVITNPLKT